MGTVVLTQERHNMIMRKVRDPYNNKISDLNEKIFNDPVLFKYIHMMHFQSKEQMELIYQIPDIWFAHTDSLPCSVVISVPDSTPERHIVLDGCVKTDSETAKSVRVPFYANGYTHRIERKKLSIPSTYGPLNHIREWMLEKYGLETECDKVSNEISALIKQAKTLKTLMSVWPSAIDYVDESTRQQFFAKPAKVERTKREALAAAISDDVKVSLIKQRLTGS